ncbi:hypothetical protein [Rhizobium leguminosarum]|uniref:hypothetical protein n=1 Tax=Rhizobium TaxID=379 RepID=UPI0013B955F8|nr:hypothetical protein [Rhizobium leguminosarum]WSG96598.1 hypothetical protein U8P76_06875 [Rhizobium johnstonii]MBY5320979.1 hypothetical protein [Rhizobium leguminosarum]MBY5380861.1 hypothetical protein [Rhizobium leguminosarum]MCA2432166.1 hypothetical protein [Rhizobium leguminosarum]NEH42661.1 hypothetical protein [Rhizobium leguminosarum]
MAIHQARLASIANLCVRCFSLTQLNRVRNEFGHQLNHVVEFQEINSIMQILRIARSETNFTTPMDAIEAFAAIACAFLSIPPKHLQEVFKQVHTEMPD